MAKLWTLAEARPLIQLIEDKCPEYGCHVALTGGVLYKGGERKDLDLLFYRIRQTNINLKGLFEFLQCELGIHVQRDSEFGTKFVAKAKYFGKDIDIFFPEVPEGEYTG